MVKLLTKIQTLEAQKSLLSVTINKKELLNSKIISSLQPKIGKRFENPEIERKKTKILQETRKKLIILAMEDKEIVLHQTSSQFDQLKETYEGKGEDLNKFYNRIDALIQSSSLNKVHPNCICCTRIYFKSTTISM